MSDQTTTVSIDGNTATVMAKFDVIDEYTPPSSPTQHSRQRSLTTTLPSMTHPDPPHPPPKRQNSIKRMTFRTLKSTSTMHKEKKNKNKSPLTRTSSGNEEYAETVGSSYGDVCTLHKPRKSTLIKSTTTASGCSSLPLFPSLSEVEDGASEPKVVVKPTIVLEGPVFKCPLPELLVKESKIARGSYKIFIPYLVENCVSNLLSDEILKQEGIFRQSGRLMDNQAMKALYDKGKYMDVHDYPDSYTIAALLKLYLRELPEPLITFNSYSQLVDLGRQIVEGKDAPIEGVREVIKMLPLANKTILKILFELLGKVAGFESFNKMSPSNLAIVIAPNIMWSNKPMTTLDVINDSPAINHVTALLITQHSAIFGEDEDTKYVTVDILTQQHNSLPDKFPSFSELQEEQNQPAAPHPRKKSLLEKAFARLTNM